MLNWLPTELHFKQVVKYITTRLNALSRWRIVPYDNSGYLDINYLPVEYCFNKGFNFQTEAIGPMIRLFTRNSRMYILTAANSTDE